MCVHTKCPESFLKFLGFVILESSGAIDFYLGSRKVTIAAYAFRGAGFEGGFAVFLSLPVNSACVLSLNCDLDGSCTTIKMLVGNK